MAAIMSRSVPFLLASLAAFRSGLAIREVGLHHRDQGEESVEEKHVAHSAAKALSQENASQEEAAAVDVHLGSLIECNEDQWKEFKQTFRGDDGKPAKLNSNYRVQLNERWWFHENSLKFSDNQKCNLARNVLWLYPKWRGAGNDVSYTVTHNTCYQMMAWSRHACHVRFQRVESLAEAIEILNEYGDGKLMHVVIGAYPVETTEKLKRLEFGDQTAACGTSKLCMDDEGRSAGEHPAFLSTLTAKLAPYASVFIDSARQGSPDATGVTWTQFLADQVGKGARVLGSHGEYDKVQIVRVEEYYPIMSNLRKAGLTNLQVESFSSTTAGSTCEGAGGQVEEMWSCKCPQGTACRTSSGSLCPIEDGLWSNDHFLAACASSTSTSGCTCKSVKGSGCENEDSGDMECCKALPFARKRHFMGALFKLGGKCKCVGSLQHANGKSGCAKAGKKYFSPEDDLSGCACAAAPDV